MRLAIVAVLAVGAVIVGSVLTIQAWQEAIDRLEQKIDRLEAEMKWKQTVMGDTVFDQRSKIKNLEQSLQNTQRQVSNINTILPKMIGYVYQDTNGNGERDQNEPGSPCYTVSGYGFPVTYTDSDGRYILPLNPGRHLISIQDASIGLPYHQEHITIEWETIYKNFVARQDGSGNWIDGRPFNTPDPCASPSNSPTGPFP